MGVPSFLKRAQDLEQAQRSKVFRKKSEHIHDESNWLYSYSDMMTLLCGFFIMMFALSTLNKSELEKVKKILTEQFGGKYTLVNEGLTEKFTTVIEESGLKESVEL